jgi:Divergent InlB B-repeat domain
MSTTCRWSVALAVALLAGCSSTSPAPPAGPAGVSLEVLQRTSSGRVEGVAGVQVQRHDATTGAYVETKTTDAAGRADFGVQPGPVTLSVIRPAVGGLTRAYTLLGFTGGAARLRLDRLPEEPAPSLATVDVPLLPALKAIERADAWLPSGRVGFARPGATAITGVAITDHDLQSDGLVTLLAEVEDDEMGTAVGCRLSADQPVTAATNTLSAGVISLPVNLAVTGTLTLDRIVAVRRGVAFPTRPATTCASAFTDADGFSAQGSLGLPAPAQQVPNFYVERRGSEKRGALWVQAPTIAAGASVAVPTADATIEALSAASGTIRATLKGTAVRSLVGAQARIAWPVSATEARIWYLYGGLAIAAASCDGTATDPACTIEQRLPALAAMGVPPDQAEGLTVEVEAVAPSGATSAADFWSRLAAEGDAAAVLARGYTGAYRSLALSKPSFILDVAPYVRPGWLPLGKVVGTDGIDCSLASQANCTKTLTGGTAVTLTAIPNTGAELVGWLGAACSGAGTATTVSFIMDKDVNCSPQFRSTVGLPANQLNVGVISAGNGWITSSDGWISCGYDTFHVVHSSCTFNYSSGTQVVLSATPSDSLNPYKATWSGDCTGNSGTVSVIMSAPRNCQVSFGPP